MYTRHLGENTVMRCSWFIPSALLLMSPLLGADNPLSGILGPESLKSAELSGVRLLPGERPDSVILKFAAREKPSTFVVRLPAAGPLPVSPLPRAPNENPAG